MPNADTGAAPLGLFAYGTLQDPEIQQLLFGYRCAYKNAELAGWSLYSSRREGYLFIKPDPSGSVSGRIVEVDAEAIATADLWEEVPFYVREKVVVTVKGGARQEAWAYTRRDAEGDIYRGNLSSLLDRQSVLNAAAEARKRSA